MPPVGPLSRSAAPAGGRRLGIRLHLQPRLLRLGIHEPSARGGCRRRYPRQGASRGSAASERLEFPDRIRPLPGKPLERRDRSAHLLERGRGALETEAPKPAHDRALVALRLGATQQKGRSRGHPPRQSAAALPPCMEGSTEGLAAAFHDAVVRVGSDAMCFCLIASDAVRRGVSDCRPRPSPPRLPPVLGAHSAMGAPYVPGL
jgi:hypothetical protein